MNKMINEELKQEWVELYNSGLNCREIAERYDEKYSVVYNALRGLVDKNRIRISNYPLNEWSELFKSGKTYAEIGEMYNVPEHIVRYQFVSRVRNTEEVKKLKLEKKEQRRKEFQLLHDSGKSYEEIGEIHGLSVYKVQRILGGYRREKFESRRQKCRKLYAQGVSKEDLCKKYGVLLRIMNDILKGCPKQTKPDLTDEWIRLYLNGYSITDLAKAYHCGNKTVSKAIRGKIEIRPGRKKPDVIERFKQDVRERIKG